MADQPRRSVLLCVSRHPSGALQLSIDARGDAGGHGYRIAGPKFAGTSEPLMEHSLTAHDAEQIRSYLNEAFPPAAQPQDTGNGR